MGCLHRGCERPVRSLGYCGGHYQQLRRRGHTSDFAPHVSRPAIDRLFECIAIPSTYVACWLWTGKPTQGTGYGRFRMQGRTFKAHVATYRLAIGPVPDGLELDHLCCNRMCVNPLHLEPVTKAENARRAVALRYPDFQRGSTALVAARRRQGPRTHCKNGHELTPENTRREATGRGGFTLRCLECARAKHRRWLDRQRSSK